MDLESIHEYLESPYLEGLRSYVEGESVFDEWQQIFEQTLFTMYNDGASLSTAQRFAIFSDALVRIGDWQHAIYTEERDELCRIFGEIAKLASIQSHDGLSIEQWLDANRVW